MQITNYGAFPQSSQANYKRVQFAASWNANLVYHPRRHDIIVCDVEDGVRQSCLSAHMETVYCCVAQPRTDVFFTAGRDSNIVVWHPRRRTKTDAESDDGEDAWSDED